MMWAVDYTAAMFHVPLDAMPLFRIKRDMEHG